jgi:hypothetical protein
MNETMQNIQLRHHLLLTLIAFAFAGCGVFPEAVKMGDPKLKPFSAMYKVNRSKLGFTPIPKQADVRIEKGSRSGYDAMLHIYAETSRTVAFKKVGNSYVWIGEQEIHTGPGAYTSPDGTFNEQITITYETSPVSGVPLNKTYVTYAGNDPVLSSKPDLTLRDVLPTLKKWRKKVPQTK